MQHWKKSVLSFICLISFSISINVTKTSIEKCEQNESVKRFREYIQIDTSREEKLNDAVEFWKRQAEELGLRFQVLTPSSLPICVITWEGSDPSLPAIMLNSHMDVVTAVAENWRFPPFEAHIDEEGNIYGRGTQDTKDVGIQYLEAIRKLKADNVTLKRTFYITLMPDEETGGYRGIIPFLKTEEFKQMNIGFALDEGLTSIDSNMFVTYVDRRPWQMKFKVFGNGGHGSLMFDGSAMDKIRVLINSIMDFREIQKSILKSTTAYDYGAYTSLNINILEGGIATNIIPDEMSLVLDMRLSENVTAQEMDEKVNSWIKQAGNGTDIVVEYSRRIDVSSATSTDDSNPYWVTMKKTLQSMGTELIPVVCPATSDMVFVRNLGIPAFGFTPRIHTITRMHANNEYHNCDTFLRGIDVYVSMLSDLGNLS